MTEVDTQHFCEICKTSIDWDRELILDNLSKCLLCDTIYHKSHLEDWLGSKSFCPNCRFDISKAEIYNFAPSNPIPVIDYNEKAESKAETVNIMSQEFSKISLYGVWLSINSLWQFLLFFMLLFNNFSYYSILLTQSLLVLLNIKLFLIFLLPLLIVNILDLNKIIDGQTQTKFLVPLKLNLVLNLLAIGLYLEISKFY